MPIVLERFGDAAMRARLPPDVEPRALLAALRALPCVIDAIVTERHALVTFDPASPPKGLESVIESAALAPASAGGTQPRMIAVRYDGADLEHVARMSGLDPGQVIALHAGAEYVATAIGFLPGFAYLRGLDARLTLPRRATPRARVPAFSLAIAGPYTGIYPFASPGGWHIIGTAVSFVPFDPSTGARIAIGDRVRFVDAEPAAP